MGGPLVLTLELATLTTAVLLAIATPLAAWLAFSRHPLRPLVEALLALPLVLPPTVLGFYLLVAMAPHGWLGRLWEALFHARLAFSFSGLVLASVCYSLPFALQPIQTAFAQLDRRLLDAAWTLGASRWQTFWRILLPLGVPGIFSGAVLAFAHTLGEFGVVLMVGGDLPGRTRVVSIALYDLVQTFDYQSAGRLALLLLAIAYLTLLALYAFQRHMLRWGRP
ncbi:MAG TPA: molybdate ABC transporter permease subunit [Oscillatoriaceae cyanobacterium]